MREKTLGQMGLQLPRTFPDRVFPIFLKKVLIGSRALSERFLIGPLIAVEEGKGKSGKSWKRANRENPGKKGKIPPKSRESQTSVKSKGDAKKGTGRKTSANVMTNRSPSPPTPFCQRPPRPLPLMSSEEQQRGKLVGEVRGPKGKNQWA